MGFRQEDSPHIVQGKPQITRNPPLPLHVVGVRVVLGQMGLERLDERKYVIAQEHPELPGILCRKRLLADDAMEQPEPELPEGLAGKFPKILWFLSVLKALDRLSQLVDRDLAGLMARHSFV